MTQTNVVNYQPPPSPVRLPPARFERQPSPVRFYSGQDYALPPPTKHISSYLHTPQRSVVSVGPLSNTPPFGPSVYQSTASVPKFQDPNIYQSAPSVPSMYHSAASVPKLQPNMLYSTNASLAGVNSTSAQPLHLGKPKPDTRNPRPPTLA